MRWLLIVLVGSTAYAGSREQKAQVVQLHEELIVLVRKNAWSGVERAYVQLVSLGQGGAELEHEHHVWGAMAAQSRGDVMATYERLRAAQAIHPRQETTDWIAMIEVEHGRVSIELSPLVFGDVTIVSIDPVSPAAGVALQAASQRLSERRRFDGLLPLGRYRVGSAQFELYGQPEPVRVAVDPGKGGKLPPEPPGMVRLVATQLPSDPAAFAPAAEAARVVVSSLPGVAKVEVVLPPAERLYAEFDGSSLDALGLTPTDLARQIREPLGLDPLVVTVRASAIGLPADGVTIEKLGALPVTFEGGAVTLASVARIRRAPDHTAAPPGLAITLAEGADRELVREQASAALEHVEAAAPLALATH